MNCRLLACVAVSSLGLLSIPLAFAGNDNDVVNDVFIKNEFSEGLLTACEMLGFSPKRLASGFDNGIYCLECRNIGKNFYFALVNHDLAQYDVTLIVGENPTYISEVLYSLRCTPPRITHPLYANRKRPAVLRKLLSYVKESDKTIGEAFCCVDNNEVVRMLNKDGYFGLCRFCGSSTFDFFDNDAISVAKALGVSIYSVKS